MFDTRRREFMTLLGGAAAWPVAAHTQQPAMPTIGFLSSRSANDSALHVAAFRKALSKAGYVEGQKKVATRTIPIVFVSGEDPVKFGLVASLNKPGGNITGVSTFNAEPRSKRLELLHKLVPKVTTIALLVNPNFPGAGLEIRETQVADISAN